MDMYNLSLPILSSKTTSPNFLNHRKTIRRIFSFYLCKFPKYLLVTFVKMFWAIKQRHEFVCKHSGQLTVQDHLYPLGKCMFKVNKRNARTRCEICSKLTIKTPERHQQRRSDVFVVNFEHISPCSCVSIVNTEQVNAGWDKGNRIISIVNVLLFSLLTFNAFTSYHCKR